jgi:hypothetical protein
MIRGCCRERFLAKRPFGGAGRTGQQVLLAANEERVHDSIVSAVVLLKEVQALPQDEREKCVFGLLDGEETASRSPVGKNQRVKWPDVQARARRIFGKRVFPNLVLLERSEAVL